MGLWTLGWPELPPDIYLPEKSQAENFCSACGGNDGDMPCAHNANCVPESDDDDPDSETHDCGEDTCVCAR